MSERIFAAIAALVSSTLLIVLVFAFAIWRDAFWGATASLMTAALVYVFHTLQYYEIAAAEMRNRYYEPSPLANALFPASVIIGFVAALLAFAGA